MKKTIALVLALAICLSLCACVKSDACTCDCPQCAQCEYKTHSHEEAVITGDPSAAEGETEDGKRRIEFPEPVLLAEDDKVRIELMRFFEEDSAYKHVGKFIALKITNKADYEIGVRLENLAVDGNISDCSYPGGNLPNLLAGETTTYQMEIMDNFQNTLDSLDLLYALKGRLEVMKRRNDGVYTDSYELPFSVESALSSGISYDTPADPKKEYTPGETVSTDMAQFTLNEFVFRKGLATYSESSGNINDLYLPEEGMVFATSKFSLCNLSGESYNVHSSVQIYVDYNNGFRYSTKDRHNSYLSHSKGIWKMTGNGAGSGYFAELSPLMTGSYDLYIPVPQMVEIDTEAPLCIIAELPTSSGSTQEFVYRIR